jgi:hypothetical protein
VRTSRPRDFKALVRSADHLRWNPNPQARVRPVSGTDVLVRRLSGLSVSDPGFRCPKASYSIQPSSFIAQPAFQIFVMWLILPSSNSIS